MNAGRELDALIAEKVFGWSYKPYGNGGGSWTLNGKQMAFGGQQGGSLPSYSTDIAAAWEVVEKIKATRQSFVLTGLWGGPYIAEFDGGGVIEGRYAIRETAGTAPLAICLAALKAVEATP